MTPSRQQPTDPRTAALIRMLGGRGTSRRSFMHGAAGAIGTAALLAACGRSGDSASTPSTSGSTTAAIDPAVRWASWTLYLDMDEDGTSYPTLDAYEEKSGNSVVYTEDIEGNLTFYDVIAPGLEAGKDCGYDLITMTDWMAGRLIRKGWIEQLATARIPNAENILPALFGVPFDLGRIYSLTWQSGFAGIAWDKEKLPNGINAVSDLWAPELAGGVEVLSEMNDTMGLLMLDNGVDISGNWGMDDFVVALDLLSEKIASGHIRSVKGNSYSEDLRSGDAVACFAWSGDIAALNAETGDRFGFALPAAGGTLWSDNLMIPLGAPNKAAAEDLINYYYDPEVAAEVAAWVNYITPVQGAQEAMEHIAPELVDNPYIFPDDSILAKAHAIRVLEADEEEQFLAAFADAIG